MPNTENRWGNSSSFDSSSYDNDSMGYTAQTAIGFPVLQSVPQPDVPNAQPPVAAGAYTNPSLTYAGEQVSLRTNETPNAGSASVTKCTLPSRRTTQIQSQSAPRPSPRGA